MDNHLASIAKIPKAWPHAEEAQWVRPIEVSEAPLPKGWEKVFDVQRGQHYYWHAALKKSTWERPEASARMQGKVVEWNGVFGWLQGDGHSEKTHGERRFTGRKFRSACSDELNAERAPELDHEEKLAPLLPGWEEHFSEETTRRTPETHNERLVFDWSVTVDNVSKSLLLAPAEQAVFLGQALGRQRPRRAVEGDRQAASGGVCTELTCQATNRDGAHEVLSQATPLGLAGADAETSGASTPRVGAVARPASRCSTQAEWQVRRVFFPQPVTGP
eukprot:g442.t3